MIDYIQTNTYSRSKVDNTDSVQEFSYRRDLRVIPLKMKSNKKVFYNKELNMYFESPESFYSYEIEVEDVLVNIAKEFRKSQDFLRRLNYKYDWIHLEQSDNGKITGVSNLDELRKNWTNLKQRILQSYKGEAAESYLERISMDFEHDSHFKDIFSQYYEYGLLFSPIPESHGEEWKIQRLIKLDNTPETELLETLSFKDKHENTRRYILDWKKRDLDSPIALKAAKGNIEYCTLSKTIKKAEANIIFAYDDSIINEWNFRLDKIKNLNNQTL